MSLVRNGFARTATMLALCLSLGFHWMALQSVAWTTMLVSNARSAPLSEALARTFDGAHPCTLCHAVADGHKSEKKSELPPAWGKVDLICTTQRVNLLPPWVIVEFPIETPAISEFSFPPPAPPPRSFAI